MLVSYNAKKYTYIHSLISVYLFSELSDHDLKRKIELSHDLLEIADKVEPGYSRFRGTLLLDLQAAMTIMTKREFEVGKITKAGAQVICILFCSLSACWSENIEPTKIYVYLLV